MPLPQVVLPTYRLVLPSNGKEIQFRPFVAKEEKILIIAMESQDEKQIKDAIKTVLKNCIITKGIKVEELPTFDIEFIFLRIRAQSIGNKVEAVITCPDDGVTEVKLIIDLDDVKVEKSKNHKNEIDLGNNMILRLKYPSINEFIETNFATVENGVDSSYKIIANCIDIVYQGEEAWSAKDCTQKELIDWVENLPGPDLRKINDEFLETMPVLRYKVKVKNPKTKVESEVVLEGLSNFFA